MSVDSLFRADAVIGRLRITGTRGDPVGTRLRAARLLDADAFRPPGLPPSAILCIRTLRDRLPGQFPAAGSAIRPPGNWSRALASRIETLARYARRPALDPALDDVPAVLFIDPSELIACLARDWIDGSAIRRWWWQPWLRGAGVEMALLKLCDQHPIDLPAALNLLARSGDVIRFARRLSPAAVERLIGNMLTTFALSDLSVALTDRGETVDDAADDLPPTEPGAPWQRIAPESADRALTPAARGLVGIGLTLARAPLIARRPEYAESTRHWVRYQLAPRSSEAARPPRENPAFAPRQTTLSAAQDPVNVPDRSADDVQAPIMPPSEQTIDAASETPERLETAFPAAESVDAALIPAVSEPLETAAEIRAIPAEAINTAYGGIFYLVNLALYLGLYGDASTPRQSGIDLPLWDFVALVGERLVGEALHADPVWALLARLAGRPETDRPGADFTPSDRWHIPADWLRAFPEPGIWRWNVSGGRLMIDHPAGFRAVDVPLPEQDGVSDLLHTLTEPYRGTAAFELARAPIIPLTTTELIRWLDWLMAYIDARLKRAFNLEEPIGGFLCRHPARIHATGAHLDIILSLQTLPIEIRFAGLDRDPGWIPAAATSIRFHFE